MQETKGWRMKGLFFGQSGARILIGGHVKKRGTKIIQELISVTSHVMMLQRSHFSPINV